MSRTGYTNLAPAEERGKLLATICDHLALDAEQHSARVDAIDYALRVAAREIGDSNVKQKAKKAGFDEVGGRVVHRCDTSVLPRASVTQLDQETTRYECPKCGASVTVSYEDR